MFGLGRQTKKVELVRLRDGRIAEYDHEDVSPYPAEERVGIRRTYVVSIDPANAWADWVLPGEIARRYTRTASA